MERLKRIITRMENVIRNERLETNFEGLFVRSIESELRNADPRSHRFERIKKSLASAQETMIFMWGQIDHFINMRNYVIVQAALRNRPLPVSDHAPIRSVFCYFTLYFLVIHNHPLRFYTVIVLLVM
jgi:hypothetical protein